jgi:mono/diheme cytochrome c family protein
MAERHWSAAGKLLTLILLAAVAVALFAVLSILQHGVSARESPTKAEETIATTMRHFAVPRAAREMKNPLPASDVVVAEGRDHFADHCATCHGNDGKGDTNIGHGLYPKVPDMSDGSPDLTDGELFYIIKNGVRLTGMPAWGDPKDARGDKDDWELVQFIRHLPKITPAELEQMKALNPTSPVEWKEKKEEDEFLSGKDEKPSQ